MSEKLVITAKMKARALTKLKIYWNDPIDGQEHQTWYSLDRPGDRRLGNPEPGIARLIACFVLPNLGKFRVALIYLNQPDQRLPFRKYNKHGVSVAVDEPITYPNEDTHE